MAVRNWWVTTKIDGRTRALTGGPLAADGGLTVELMQRDKGKKIRALRIDGLATHDGRLVLWVIGPDGQEFRWETLR